MYQKSKTFLNSLYNIYLYVFLYIFTYISIFTINFINNYVKCDSDKKYIEISKKFYYKSQLVCDISKILCITMCITMCITIKKRC